MNTFRCCSGLQLISTCAEPVLLLCRAAGLSPLSVISLCFSRVPAAHRQIDGDTVPI